jgi:tRNA (guanosine-2'-O-)-methyltransferase
MNKKLIEYLSEFALEERVDLFNEIINNRTKYMTIALEDIYQSHNASAVLRSCDCFGVQDVHIIENNNEYRLSSEVSVGSDKWLNLIKYNKTENNTIDAIRKLKKDGYRIVATTPHINDVNLENFDIEKGKFALFFGAELKGLSETVLSNADEFLKIPMYGFTESFNISVSAALIMHTLYNKLKNSKINWNLNEDEKNKTLLCWLENSIKSSDLLIKRFLEENK